MSRLDKYDPGFLQAWLDSAKAEVSFKKPTKANAIELRHYLYRLRVDMGKDGHPGYLDACKVKISLREVRDAHGSYWLVLLRPRNDEEALASAGYTIPEAPKFE